jgi:hypothetical protein
MKRGPLVALAVSAAMTVLAPPRAKAQQAGEAALAQRLFEEGRELVGAGRYAEACPKFAESQRLDPAVGTLLNLGQCYEKTNRPASAWATYKDAEASAARAGQRERAASAAARAEELRGALPSVVVDVPRPVPGLVVRCAGREIGSAVWGVAIPVDPGPVRIEASAPSRAPWSREVDVTLGAHARVSVPELDPAAAPQHESSALGRSSTPRVLAFAGGAAFLVGGAVTAIAAIEKYHTADRDHCTARGCDDEGLRQIDGAKTLAVVSQISLLVGAAGVASGFYLLLSTPTSATPVRAAVAPGSLRLEAAF